MEQYLYFLIMPSLRGQGRLYLLCALEFLNQMTLSEQYIKLMQIILKNR